MLDFFNIDTIKDNYDLIIIGGGPAGASAAIYAARDQLDVLILEKLSPGGQIAITSEVDNYPAIEHISGYDLGEKFKEHALKSGADIRNGTVYKVEDKGKEKFVYIEGREKPITTKTVIVASGCKARALGVDGEDRFWGRGISTCGTCDGAFFKNKTIVAVGGGNTALEEADYLTRFANKVYLVHRKKTYRANATIQKIVKNNSKIVEVLDSVITSINGDKKLESVDVLNIVTNEKTNIITDGVFIFIGQIPMTEPFKDLLTINDEGFIIADESTKTNIPGIYVAGDVRSKEIRQIATATSDGVVAAKMVAKYIQENY